MAFKDLNMEQRLIAVHSDMLRNPEFCVLGSVSQIGNVVVDDKTPTAKTDGHSVWYGRAFAGAMPRKQLRYLVAHENGHKMLRHCTEYKALAKKYPELMPIAVDYVVNGLLEQTDSKFGTPDAFLERPTEVPPLVDPKYFDMSVPEVLRDLLQNGNPQGGKGKGAGQGSGNVVFDEHAEPEGEGENGELTEEQAKKVQRAIEEAVLQGEIVQNQLRGNSGSPNKMLSGFREQKTDWRSPLRRFFQDIVEGDEQSRFSPPNKRMMPQGIIMPSHFSEATGEVIVACDTSGSMSGIYPILFGELCRICQTVQPAKIRVLWWDTRVASEQIFVPADYDKIRDLLKPMGGGGTTVSCVAQYVSAKGYKPKATVYITDGYLESQFDVVPGTVLWGVIGNKAFRPPRGKVLHIEED